jgi:hypothetical protein
MGMFDDQPASFLWWIPSLCPPPPLGQVNAKRDVIPLYIF